MKANLRRMVALFLCCALVFGALPGVFASAMDAEIVPVRVSGYGNGANVPARAIDGNTDTYWQSPAASSMLEYMRFLDIHLDGLYDLSKIEILNRPGAYYHYEVYASYDGDAFTKIAYKSDNTQAGSTATAYDVSAKDGAKNVSQVRVSVSYNSAALEVNLAEVKLYGTKVSDTVPTKPGILVEDFSESKWASEYEKFETDAAYAEEKTLLSLSDMVGRVIGDAWKDDFVFELADVSSTGDRDAYEIETRDGKVYLRGRNGISLASGFNYYLKNYAYVNYNPIFASNVEMPATLPAIPQKLVKETQYNTRYALNFCTYAYTMSFWGWNEYEAFLDWAAMNGINIMLDLVGQEEVQRRLLRAYGYTDEEIKLYISGPGYFPWFYMQNMSGFGGPLPDDWFAQRVELGRKMHDRMQAFGIQPILQGYAGMVPTDFGSKNPDAALIGQGNWCGFVRPTMLKTYGATGKDYFAEMAETFYRVQKDVFGDVTDYFAVDPFHEGGILGGMDAATVYRYVQGQMLSSHPDAIWVLMQWQGQIYDAKISNLVKPKQVLVLDLQSDRVYYSAVMERQKVPWVWCMLHNFGGRMGVDGDIVTLTQEIPRKYYDSQYMTGLGITPEAFGNSAVVYDLALDMAWTKDPIDPYDYVERYAKSRYGRADENILKAWNNLLKTAYWKKAIYTQGAAESVINARPSTSFSAASTWGHSVIEYDKKAFEETLLDFIAAYDEYQDQETFIFDMVDVTKQVLATSAIEYHKQMMEAYNKKDKAEFKRISDKFLELIRLQDEVLACSGDFTVGKWIDGSRAMYEGMDDWTKDLFEFNARAQITTWAGSKSSEGGGLKDYSNRQWSGLTKDYYLARWEDFVKRYATSLETGNPPASKNYFLQEWEWANRKSDQGDGYSSAPRGNLKELAQKVYDEFSLTKMDAFLSEAEGVQNLAQGKAVVCSVEGTSVAALTDNDLTTTWRAGKAGAVEFTIDLSGNFLLDKVEFALPQVAGDYPWDYGVSLYMDGKWNSLLVSQYETLLGIISVPCDNVASRVKFSFSPKTSAAPDLTAEFAELMVFGKAAPEPTYENLALGKAVTVTAPNGATSSTSSLTDGNLGNYWAASSEAYPWTLSLDLEKEEYADKVELIFAADGFPFKFTVKALEADGTEIMLLDMSQNTQVHQQTFSLPVNKNIRKVIVHYNGMNPIGTYYAAWASCSELRVLREITEEVEIQFVQNIAAQGVVTCSAQRESVLNMVDGNRNNYWSTGSSTYPAWVMVDFGVPKDITGVNLVFFNEYQRAQNYKIELLGADGSSVVGSYEGPKDILKDMVSVAPVSGRARYVKMTLTSALAGSSVWPGAAELEIFSRSDCASKYASITSNLVSDDLKHLVDTDPATFFESSAEGPKVFTLTLDQPYDVNALEILTGMDTALSYIAEYSYQGSAFASLKDGAATQGKPGVSVISRTKPVLADTVRVTVNEATVKLADINVYCENYMGSFLAYVQRASDQAARYTVGAYAGNISQTARDAFNAGLNEIVSRNGNNILSSLALPGQKRGVDACVNALEKQIVRLDRTRLLSAISAAKRSGQPNFPKLAVSLEDAVDAAMLTYNTLLMTQRDLDDAAVTLENRLIPYEASCQAFLEQRAKAEVLAANAVVGTAYGNVSQETLDALNAAMVEAASNAKTATTLEALDALTQMLKTACETFEKNALTTLAQFSIRVGSSQSAPTNSAIKRGTIGEFRIVWSPSILLPNLEATSSNSAVASVQIVDNTNGSAKLKVTGLRTGSAVIMVKANNGSGAVAAILVTVN